MHDETDLLESDDYYTPPCPPELREPRKKKQKAPEEPPPRNLDQKRARLDKIIADSNISVSSKQDARRILDLCQHRPREFDRDFAELMSRIKKENQ